MVRRSQTLFASNLTRVARSVANVRNIVVHHCAHCIHLPAVNEEFVSRNRSTFQKCRGAVPYKLTEGSDESVCNAPSLGRHSVRFTNLIE